MSQPVDESPDLLTINSEDWSEVQRQLARKQEETWIFAQQFNQYKQAKDGLTADLQSEEGIMAQQAFDFQQAMTDGEFNDLPSPE
jgi:hypothetical protein